MTYDINSPIDLMRVDNTAEYSPGVTVINPVTFRDMQYVRTLSDLAIGDTFSFIDYQNFIVAKSPSGTHITTHVVPANNYFWATYVTLPNTPYMVSTLTTNQSKIWTINYVDPLPIPTITNGVWTANTSYIVGNIVSDDGLPWTAINNNNTTVRPYNDPTNWSIVSYKILCPDIIPNDGDQFVISDLNGNAGVYPIEVIFHTKPFNGSTANSFVINKSYGSATFVYYGNTWRVLSSDINDLVSPPPPVITQYTPPEVTSVCGHTGDIILNVNDITDAASLISPTFLGVPRAATATLGTVNSQLATTAFVEAAILNREEVATNAINDAVTQLTTLAATVADNTAAITTNNINATAAITTESLVRANAIDAEALRRQTLVANFSQGAGKIWQQNTAPSIDDMCPIGSNRFINTAFTGVTPGSIGVPSSWGTTTGDSSWNFYVDFSEPSDSTWHLPGEHTVLISSSGTTTTSSINQNINATAGKYYEASVYVSAMHVSAYITIVYLNSSNVVVGTSNSATVNNSGSQPNLLTNYTRLYTISQAPTGTVKATVNIYCTGSISTNNRLFISRPFFGLASPTQVTPSDWTASTVDTQSWLNSSDNNRLYKWTYGSGNPAWALADDQRIAIAQAAIVSEAITRANADAASAATFNTLQTSYTNQVGNVATYSIIATGASNTLTGTAGLYLNGSTTSLATVSRSYNIWVITAATGVVQSYQNFDLVASTANATAMAAFLNALDSTVIVVISTYGEPQTNRLFGGLDTAMYRCGATKFVYGNTDSFMYRSAYILVGIPGQGAGSGIEKYSGLIDSDDFALCSFQFSIRGGIASGLSGKAMLDATLTSISASITSESETRVTETTALSTSLSTLSTTVGTHTTSISTLQTSVDGVSAQYGVTIDANGAVAGFKLLDGTGTGSAFIVTADKFEVIAPGGSVTQPIFSVSDVGGVSTVSITGNIIQNGVSLLTLTYIPQTTWYVDFQHGSDSTGDGKTTATAWATIQKAIDTISDKYIYSGTVTISCADGTLTVTSATSFGAVFNPSQISSWYLVGNTAHPENCVIDATAIGCRGIHNSSSGPVVLVVAGFTIHAYYECLCSNGHGMLGVANCNIYGIGNSSQGFVTYDSSFIYFYMISGIGCNIYGTFSNVFVAEPGQIQIGWHDVNSNLPAAFNFNNVTANNACVCAAVGGLITYDSTCVSMSGSLNGPQYRIDQGRIETYGYGGGAFIGTASGVIINYGVLT